MTTDNTTPLFPMYDRDSLPPVVVEDLKREIEEMVSDHQEIPYFAFVSGPEMNLRVEFNDYDADLHKPVVAAGLMDLIRRGADRLVIIAEVWFRNNDGTPNWHGIMILEATRDGDICHKAPFEGNNRLGAWVSGAAGDSGNLARLFARANDAI